MYVLNDSLEMAIQSYRIALKLYSKHPPAELQ